MSNLREIRNRIKSIRNTAKITHAMELVAAAKMKRAQEQATAGKPYSQLVNGLIRSIANRIHPEAHPLLARKEGPNTAVVFFATDRGLAGALNSNLFREIGNLTGNPKFITLGKKARNFVVKTSKDLIADFPLPEKPDLQSVRPIAKLITDGFLEGSYDQVHVLYTEFNSTLKQTAVSRQLLPIIDEEVFAQVSNEAERLEIREPLFEPDPDTVLESILPQYILMELYQISLEAKASEQSARMVSMKNATENALDLVSDLNLTYNGIRQEVITKEILDITTAALALE